MKNERKKMKMTFTAEVINDNRFFNGQIIVRADNFENAVRLATQTMIANKIKEVQICTNNGCKVLKTITL